MNEETQGGTTQSPPHPDQSGGPRVSRDEIRDLGRLRRTRHDKYVAGVAGGLARHLDIDPVILRVAFVVLTFFGGAGALAYAACWLLVPEDGNDEATVRLDVRSRSLALLGVGVLAALLIVGDAFGNGPGGWLVWPLLLIGLISWPFLARKERNDRDDRPATPAAPTGTATPTAGGSVGGTDAGGPMPQPTFRDDRPRNPLKRGPVLFWFVLPLTLLALGTLGIVDAAGVAVSDAAYPALALGIIAAGLLIGAFVGRAGGLIALGLIAAVALGGATITDRWDGTSIHAMPATAADVDASFDMAAGEIVLDLTEVEDLEDLDGRTLRFDGGAGRIEVRVPEEGLDTTVDLEIAGGGEIRAFGRRNNGWNPSLRSAHDGGADVPTLHVDADLFFGEIEVVTR